MNRVHDASASSSASRPTRPGRIPFLPILTSPHREDIDRFLFVEQLPVLQVHRWISRDLGVSDISYAMLWRYRRRDSPMRGLNRDVAADGVQARYSSITTLIRQGHEALEQGAYVRPSQTLQAIKIFVDMVDRLGFNAATLQAEQFEQVMRRLVHDVVLPVLADDQQDEIFRGIKSDRELSRWVLGTGGSNA